MTTPAQDCTMSIADRIKLRLWAFERDPRKIAAAVGVSPAYVKQIIEGLK